MNLILNKNHFFKILLIIILITILFSLLIYSSTFYQSVRWKTIDFLYLIQKAVFPPPNQIDQLAIVTIDDATIKKTNMRWPWSRKTIAEIIAKLNSYQPEILFLDFTFLGKSANNEDDIVLSETIKESGNIILPSYYGANMELVSPLNMFSKNCIGSGFVNKVKDTDGTIRRFHPASRDQSDNVTNYTIEAGILSNFSNETQEEIISALPTQGDKSVYINYFDRPNDFNSYSLNDIFINKAVHSELKDKIILVGTTTEITHDIYPTPLGEMAGVYVIANTLATIMSKRFLIEINYSLFLLLSILLALSIGYLTFRFGTGKGITATFIVSIIILIVSALLFRLGFILDWFSLFSIMLITSIAISFLRYVAILKINMEDLEKANIEIKNAQKEIIRREQLSTIGKLASKIIHELNNPLGNLTDCIEMLQDKIQDCEEPQKILKLAHKEVTRAKKIGEELKTSYTPHAEEKILVNINNMLSDIVDISREKIKDKGIELKVVLCDNLPKIPVSPDKLKQVFLNMILNAVDATESGKHIYLSTKLYKDSNNKEWVDVIFKDEGCGISKENLNKIMDAFFTTKKHAKGSGLGLFISYEIIRAHKGEILVESIVGKGTVFIIRLPIEV